MTKICSKCKQEKDIELFNKKKSSKDGYDTICKECQHIYDEARKEKRREYTKQRSAEKREYYRKYNQEHREEKLRYNQEHNEKQKQYCRDYRLKNIDRLRLYDRERSRLRYQTPIARLQRNISTQLCFCLKEKKNNMHWEGLLPYTSQQLIEHIEKQFTPKMSWNNYGIYWELDHIIPQNTFNITSVDCIDFKICWSLANLRPLEKIANRSRPKDGRDISQDNRDKILGQKFMYGTMVTENKEEI